MPLRCSRKWNCTIVAHAYFSSWSHACMQISLRNNFWIHNNPHNCSRLQPMGIMGYGLFCIDNMYFRILMELSVHSFSVSKKNVYSHSPKFKNINMHGALMSCIAISTIDFACTRARALFLQRDAEAKYMLQSIFYILYWTFTFAKVDDFAYLTLMTRCYMCARKLVGIWLFNLLLSTMHTKV